MEHKPFSVLSQKLRNIFHSDFQMHIHPHKYLAMVRLLADAGFNLEAITSFAPLRHAYEGCADIIYILNLGRKILESYHCPPERLVVCAALKPKFNGNICH